MKITYYENPKMNHHEIQLIVHPKNKKLAKLLTSQFKNTLGEIEVYDEYRNTYPITLLSVYYFEITDHKIYAYTEKDVFRLYCTSMSTLKDTIGTYGFYQINVRTLVNVKHVVRYKIQKGARRQIVLDNDECLISSRRYRLEFERMVEDRHEIQFVEKKAKK